MKRNRLIRKLLTGAACPAMIAMLSTPALAAEASAGEMPPLTGDQNGLILVLSALAITGLILLFAIHWGKKKLFRD